MSLLQLVTRLTFKAYKVSLIFIFIFTMNNNLMTVLKMGGVMGACTFTLKLSHTH